MLGSVAAFEIRFQLARPTTWLYLVLFVAEGFLFMGTTLDVVAGGGIGGIARNAPFSIAAALLTFTALNQVVVSGLVGTSVLRDFQFRTHELLFTTPITKRDYLGGRFVGAFVVMALVHVGLPLGLLLGSLMPWVDHAHMQGTVLLPYVTQYVTLVLPTLVVTSAIFFAVGVLTRSLFAIYTQGLALFVAQVAGGALLSNVGNQTIAALVDPFGIGAFGIITRYWSPAEKSSAAINVTGLLLANRMLWLVVAAAVLVATYYAFQFRSAPITLRRPKEEPTFDDAAPRTVAAPAEPRFDAIVWRGQVAAVARLTFVSIVRQPTFLAIVAIGIVLLFISSRTVDVLYAIPTWPLTYTLAETLSGSFALLFLLIVTLYVGEAVWRERQFKADLIVDALPTRSSVALIGNLIGVVLMEVLLLAVLIVVGMIIQTAKGYTHYEIGLYLRFLFGTVFPSLAQITVLAFLVHVLVNVKYVGHVVMMLFWGGGIVAAQLGSGHLLMRYGQTPFFRYSDFNGFGPFVPELALLAAYWTGVAGLLGVIALLCWPRGTDTTWSARAAAARLRWSERTSAMTRTSLAALVLSAAGGGAIFYNTNVRHDFESASAHHAALARYERRYKPFEKMALPRLVAADIRADLEPEHLTFGTSGTFTFVNKHARPIDSILVSVFRHDVRVDTLTFDRPSRIVDADAANNTWIVQLSSALAPGDTIRLRYRGHFDGNGFGNSGPTTAITSNGTYFRREFWPLIGYEALGELVDDDARRKVGLAPRQVAASVDDTSAWSNAYMLGYYADWISLHAVVSTSPDQIAVAPGRLVREYAEGGRRVFEYASDAPMSNDFGVLSARYAVHRETYRGITLEVLHHPTHTFNVDRMIASMKGSLDYLSSHFSPYQFKEVRIAEFPRYTQVAQALPGTIPFSESVGFTMRPGTTPRDVDLPFYVTAHEVAHQWWGHQLAGANVEGAQWLSEGLANYSALMVMEQTYGAQSVRNFLGYELDQYLLGRSAERRGERPLLLTAGQPYIHYNKGSLALYAFRDLIGEAAMTRALSHFLQTYAFKTAPYPTSRDLVRALEAETPDSLKYAITDLFTTITLWDTRADSATAVRLADGSYDVALRIRAKKFRADSIGREREIPVGDLMRMTVFGESSSSDALGPVLDDRRVWIRSADTTIHVVVRAPPARAGIDPYNTLIDRNRGDNVARVAITEKARSRSSPAGVPTPP